MADESIAIGIELGDTSQVLRSVKDITDFIDKLSQIIDDVPSIDRAISGGDPKNVKAINVEVSRISETVDTLRKEIGRLSQSGVFSSTEVAQLTQGLQSYEDTLGSITSKATGFFSSTEASAENIRFAYEALNTDLADTEESLQKLLSLQLQATSIEEWQSYTKNIGQSRRAIEDARDALMGMSAASATIERTGGLVLDSTTSVEKLEKFVFGLPEAIEEAQANLTEANESYAEAVEQQGKLSELAGLYSDEIRGQKDTIKALKKEEEARLSMLVDYNDVLIDDLDYLTEKQARLEGVRAATEDPAVLDVIAHKLEDINQEIEKGQRLLVEESSVESLITSLSDMELPLRSVGQLYTELRVEQTKLAMANIAQNKKLVATAEANIAALEQKIGAADRFQKEQAEAAKKAIESEVAIKAEIINMQNALGELAKLRRMTYDVDQLALIVKKEEQITAEIEKRNEELKKSQDLREKGAGGSGTLSQSGAGANISGAMSSIAAASNTIGSLGSIVDDLGGGLLEMVGILEDSAEGIGEAGLTLSEFLLGIGGIVEDQQSTFQSVMDIQDTISGFGKNLKGWSTNIQATNKAVVNSGRPLGMFRKSMGGVSKGLSGLSGAMGGLSKAAGVAGAALQGAQIGFQVYDMMMGTTSEKIEERIQALRAEAERVDELNDLIEQGSQSARQEQIDAIQDEIDSIRQHRQALQQSGTTMATTFDQARTVIGYFLGDTRAYGRAADEIIEATSQIEELEEQMADLTSATTVAAIELESYRNELEEGAQEAIGELEKAERDLFDARVDISKKQYDLVQQLVGIQDDYNDKTTELARDREEQDIDAVRSYLQEMSGLEEDYQKKIWEMNVDHAENLVSMEESYLESLADLIGDYEEARADAITEYNEKEQEALLQYQEEQLESQEDYNKKIAKMEEDFNKEKVKRQKDLERQLFEAEMENDALRFFMLQRQGEEEEKEAEQQHEEEMDEAAKEFEEEKKQREADFQERKEERRMEHQEELANMREAHTEKLAERKEQFDEELQQAREAHNEKLAEEEGYYLESRAKATEAYERRLEDMELARAREDADRLERLQARRKEANDAFQTELEYFQLREQALTDLISQVSDLEAQRDTYLRFAQAGGGLMYQDAAQQVAAILQEEINRISSMAPGGDISQLQEADRASLTALQQMLSEIESGLYAVSNMPDAPVNLDLNRWIDDPTLTAAGINISQVLAQAVNTAFDEEIVEVREGLDTNLTYFTEDLRAIADSLKGLQGADYSLFEDLTRRHQAVLEQMGLNQEDWNMMTVEEQQRYLDAQLALLEEQGEESVGELRETAEGIGEEARTAFQNVEDETIASGDRLVADTRAHFAEREEDESQFQEDVETATEMAHDERLDDEEHYNEAAAALGEEGKEESLGIQEEGIEASADLQKDAQEEEMSREEEHLSTKEELANEFFNAELERMQKYFEEKEQLSLTMHELEMERLMLQFERENEMWIVFMENLTKIFDETSKRVFVRVSQAAQSEGNRIVSTYSQINSAIVQSAAQAYGTLMGYIAQAQSQTTMTQWGKGGSQPKKGIFAAKGALIDRPTLMVAGEGERPEIVVPFDESKGIPDDVMRSFANAFTGGSGATSDDLTAAPVGGNMSSQMLGAILTQLKTMQIGMDLRIDNIEVGSNISRQEVREQFAAMQKSIISAMHSSIN